MGLLFLSFLACSLMQCAALQEVRMPHTMTLGAEGEAVELKEKRNSAGSAVAMDIQGDGGVDQLEDTLGSTSKKPVMEAVELQGCSAEKCKAAAEAEGYTTWGIPRLDIPFAPSCAGSSDCHGYGKGCYTYNDKGRWSVFYGGWGTAAEQERMDTMGCPAPGCKRIHGACDVEKKTCAEGQYLTNENACLEECPPGSYKDTDNGVRLCTPCDGVTRRRNKPATTPETRCTQCPNGHVGQANNDECQNFQETCNEEQCEACQDCFDKVKPHLKSCLKHHPSMHCIDPESTWCGTFMFRLNSCEGFSVGCFYKLMCHDPRICPSWKAVRCGGSATNALLQANLSTSLLTRQVSEMTLGERMQVKEISGLDSSLSGKCHT